ncbi:MAG: hypothetical protein M1837_000217 [Sclerophora amabilis]|nr:MAG: hypothetical protein M1837_000217 [Sclerophora amabilis]
MAPNKRKKKAASNPARGFATTSISKKAEVTDSPGKSEAATPVESPVIQGHDEPATNFQETTADTQTDQLSPEELVRQLEESELQGIVEKFGPRAKKDSRRQASRLHTDRRLLRGQSEHIKLAKWLPKELMDEIIEFIGIELRDSLPQSSLNGTKNSILLPEEEQLARLWALQRTLLALHFPVDKVKEVLRYVLDSGSILHGTNSGSNDLVWGLDESLEWLSLSCSTSELPPYEGQQQPSNESNLAGTRATTPETPSILTLNSNGEQAVSSAPSQDTGLKLGDVTDRHANGVPSKPSELEVEEDNTPDNEVSDLDSDLDPEELLSTYLSVKTALYLVEPESTKTFTAKHSKSKTPNQSQKAPLSTKGKALQKKLDLIETDVLFDSGEAIRHWAEKRIGLDIENAHRKKLGLGKLKQEKSEARAGDGRTHSLVAHPSTSNGIKKGADDITTHDPDSDDSDEGFNMLEGLYPHQSGSLPDSITEQSTEDTKMTIRDFGKWNGMNPRRVLEEACRSRDSKVRLSFRVISSTNFSKRHSTTVSWSKDQEPLPFLSIPSLEVTTKSRELTVSMTSVSTPDTAQSESFVSTAALFILFSSSPKEEKLYLRMPSVWRNLWSEFGDVKKDFVDQEDRKTLSELRQMLEETVEGQGQNAVTLRKDSEKLGPNIDGKVATSNSEARATRRSVPPGQLQDMWRGRSLTEKYQQMLKTRMQLPIWAFKDELMSVIDREQVVIICGETGCGKSTQVPSFLLEHELLKGQDCKVYCTQPRRISAITLAQRVAQELAQEVGTPSSLVGYAIRLESKVSEETRLVYATTGIVMRMLERSNDLGDITHLILDEVHERSIDSDFLLIILRRLMIRRPELKVVLMSATVDAQRFSHYLGTAPIFNVPGRTFPVRTEYLEDAIELTGHTVERESGQAKGRTDSSDTEEENQEGTIDSVSSQSSVNNLTRYSGKTKNTLANFNEYRIDYDLIGSLVEKIATDQRYHKYSKAILVFLPGLAEIRKLNDILVGQSALSADCKIFPLHSSIASEEQESAFLVPPKGTRKIVLATNIAETGITIPDVTCVIDTGKHKEMRFDERRQLSRLVESFISRANAAQRRGRAGRVQEGLCFHLFTKARHDNQMTEEQTPEMLRLSLQDLVLRVKICELGNVEDTLLQALSPPTKKNIDRAIIALIDVKALTQAQELTPLGRQLAKLPLDVHLGKLLLLGCIFRCLDTALTIAAIVSSKSPFSAPMGARNQMETARKSFRRAYRAWRNVCSDPQKSEFLFCRKNFLNHHTLSTIEDLKQQLLSSLVDAGFLTLTEAEKRALNRARFSSKYRAFVNVPEVINFNSNNDLIVGSVIAWSFYPKLLIRQGKGWRNIANNQQVKLHPTSVNKDTRDLKWLSYYHIMQANTNYNAHDTNRVEDLAVALLCGDADFRMYAGTIILDGKRARFSVSDWKVMLALKTIRTRLKQIMVYSFRNPGMALSMQQRRWFEIWQNIFSQDVEVT